MRLYKILFFYPLLFLMACMPQVPDGIIKEDKMIPLLIDIHLVDGYIYNMMNRPNDTVRKIAMNMYAAVYRRHQTDSIQFKKSFKYYSSRPEQLSKMYDVVVKKMNVRNDVLNKDYQDSVKKVVRKDSIKNALRLDSLKKVARRDSTKKVIFKRDSTRKRVVKDSLRKVKKDSVKAAAKKKLLKKRTIKAPH
ncbi:MAG: DUF4296 domain-containing protein [Sphingobacteriaceae bacterium]